MPADGVSDGEPDQLRGGRFPARAVREASGPSSLTGRPGARLRGAPRPIRIYEMNELLEMFPGRTAFLRTAYHYLSGRRAVELCVRVVPRVARTPARHQ